MGNSLDPACCIGIERKPQEEEDYGLHYERKSV